MLAPRLCHAVDAFPIDRENVFVAFPAGCAADGLIGIFRSDGMKAMAVGADGRLQVASLAIA